MFEWDEKKRIRNLGEALTRFYSSEVAFRWKANGYGHGK